MFDSKAKGGTVCILLVFNIVLVKWLHVEDAVLEMLNRRYQIKVSLRKTTGDKETQETSAIFDRV